MTATSLAMTGNLDEARLLLIAIANGVDRKLHANLTSFVSILSVTSGAMPPPPPSSRVNFFTGVQKFYGLKIFTIFTVYATIIGQLTAAFHFSNYIGEILDFTLDLPRKSNS